MADSRLQELASEDEPFEPENPCPDCKGEGAIGTGYSSSFVDVSDAMSCPACGGSGEAEEAER